MTTNNQSSLNLVLTIVGDSNNNMCIEKCEYFK